METVLRMMRVFIVHMKVAARSMILLRGRSFMYVVSLWIQILVPLSIWTSARDLADPGLTTRELVTYTLIAGLVQEFQMGVLLEDVIRETFDGSILWSAIRPIFGLAYYLTRDLASLAAYGIPSVVAFSFLAVLFHPLPPASPSALILAVVSCMLAIIIRRCLDILLACIFLNGRNLYGFLGLSNLLLSALGGGLVPLVLLPPAVYQLLAWTPFPYLANLPAVVYLGVFQSPVRLLGQQFVWAVLLCILSLFVWRSSYRRMVIHGG
ncbi:ABC-2 family transporter protein [Alicyclobacillus macrosporangiidus]|jgi:ABC-2 type transport system permease protein|uniref:ABC-type uncharacterized transport system, permease component n=1 Tax=Alicyclobacillus macrosporangiidus TaxID=392015 RepID=A0A1I7GBL3_9BACL|nr:ABC-2 family transporter protein [Alicyclobacillus macrosporangiidus]SFU45636.1 ABC-type uncharacterized transport system, permease component [Alicyclobacillus macrosporangiidus]